MARRRLGILFDDNPRYTDRFGLLLVLTAASVALLSLVDVDTPVSDLRSELSWMGVTMVVGATLLVALRASGATRRLRVIGDVIVAGAIALSGLIILVDTFTGADMGPVVSTQPGWLWVILAAAAPLLVVRRLLKAESVSRHTLAGAISAFLLIALFANYLFLTVDSVQSTPFFGVAESTTVFMYYSLVTITTLGYGDFAAATPLGRFLSTGEAVVGQVFLVTFVATLVSLHTTRLSRERRAQTGQSSDRA